MTLLLPNRNYILKIINSLTNLLHELRSVFKSQKSHFKMFEVIRHKRQNATYFLWYFTSPESKFRAEKTPLILES